MKIIRYYPRALAGDGGMTRAVRKWSEAFVAAGHEVVIAFDGDMVPPAEGTVEWRAVRHRGRGGLRTPVGLAELLRGADILVLHSGWVLHNAQAAAVARRVGVPYLLEPRGAYDPHIVRRKRLLKRMWWLALERRLVMGARAIHAFSETERPHLDALGYRGPLVVASNGTDTPEQSLWTGSGGYVLWLGRFDPEHKGLDLLLRAVALMAPQERPQLRLHGPDRRRGKARTTRMVRQLGVGNAVTVGPPVYGETKRRVLMEAAGFVYPSRWDACPNAVLESVALGIPTLVTPYPLGKQLADGGGAFLSRAEPEDLAEGLRRLRSSEAREVAARGAHLAREELSWEVVARSWLAQVETLL